ncbi:hypothetical protein CFP56_024175 [Quercus suber]|uniref:Uncharacterized protein n=1 Tax=Quercus suber TaxID=58331 RepID=A0AAW0K7C8_QUESU
MMLASMEKKRLWFSPLDMRFHLRDLIGSGIAHWSRNLADTIAKRCFSQGYWFAILNISSALKGLSQGRKEVLSFLNRRRYKEMMLASMEKKCLRFSPLDMRFDLRDLIGSGHLKTI